ncbi:zinc finger protein 43-like [Ostrinia furnacalis]|uniref:zinc finger protein 43-like n=1 Tax=Ostrinia furnacalis TaxID=93504 RepID=UPI00103D4E95|nr:zinc finger protein 43-like [Ostrinia furnacalis]
MKIPSIDPIEANSLHDFIKKSIDTFQFHFLGAPASEAASKSSHMTSTRRNRLTKRNAAIVLENSTVLPFKWHRQNFLCFFCHKTFKDANLLKEHTEEHKTSSIKSAVSFLRGDEKIKIDVTTLNCTLCDGTFSSLEDVIEHLTVTHKKSFHKECGFGLVPYKLVSDNLRCAICNEEFQYFIKLNHHMNEHFGSYVCETCGKSFLSQDRLRCHSLRHGSRHRCNFCSESFESQTQKTNHEAKIHNKVLTMKCSYCPETFASYYARKIHHKSAHNVAMQEYKCPVCGKIFPIMSRMKIHVKQVHIREKNFACTMCELRFFSRTHLNKHMIKHVGERIHQCEVCLKSYARKQTLRHHMTIHSKEKKFTCSFCSQEFSQNHSLGRHMRVHHPIDTT